MTGKQVTCPDCGLVLHVKEEREVASFKFTYGRTDWQRLCKRRNLGDPVWCLVQRDGRSERNQWIGLLLADVHGSL